MLKFIAKKELKRIFSHTEIFRGKDLKTVAHNIVDNTGVNGALMADMSQPYLQPVRQKHLQRCSARSKKCEFHFSIADTI